ncbi:MAG: hypothetical protein NTW56_15840 [Alphaproteobacteria bacterium]|nr:hypothetical protein [Alphaproteobacteria bacterium]
MDMSEFVAPKSDQLNADDLLGGPRVITITRVVGTGNADQPVSVHFDGDEGKPYKPCKSMRRVMVAMWGADAAQYAGRSMRIYRDPKVAFGGMEVGGIRISHASHLDAPITMALTAMKTKSGSVKKQFTVAVLEPEKPAEDKTAQAVDRAIATVAGLATNDALQAWTADPKIVAYRAKLRESRPDLAQRLDDAVTDAADRLAQGGVS